MKTREEKEFFRAKPLDIQSIINDLPFKIDVSGFGGKTPIIVEGSTDRMFLRHLPYEISSKLEITVADKDLFGNGKGSRKKSIEEVIYALEKVRPLYSFPKGAENWKIFGMVDLDDGIEPKYSGLKSLLYGDTHDLETMMLSSDEELIDNLPVYIPDEEKNNAYFMAYQYNLVKKASIAHTDLMVTGISAIEDVKRLFNDGMLDVEKCIRLFIKNTKSDSVNTKNLNKIVATIYKDIRQINSKHEWKIKREGFINSLPGDFWQVVNGHDLCLMLRCSSEEMANYYHEVNSNGLDRAFEVDLIENYNYSCFAKTGLYKSFVDSKIL